MAEFVEAGSGKSPLPETADEEAIPESVVGLKERDGGRKAKVVAEAVEEMDAVAVDGAEEGPLEGAVDARRDCRLAEGEAGPLLHFLRGTNGVGHDDETRQAIDGLGIGETSEAHDAFDNGAGLANTGRGDDGDIDPLFADEAVSIGLIDEVAHAEPSESWTSAHLVSRTWPGTKRVAIG